MADIVRFGNPFIESVYAMNLIQKKMLVGFARACQEGEDGALKATCDVREMCERMGVSWESRDHIKHEVKGLIGKTVDIVSKDGEDYRFTVIATQAEKEGNLLTIEFHPSMKPFLWGLRRCYTELSIAVLKPMRNKHAIRLYELCKQYASIGKRRFSIEDLRQKLGCEKSYNVSKKNKVLHVGMFTVKVLNPAVKDVNAHADIEIDYCFIKKHGKTTDVEFIIIQREVHADPAEEMLIEPSEDEIELKDRKTEAQLWLLKRALNVEWDTLVAEACPRIGAGEKTEALIFMLESMQKEKGADKYEPALIRSKLRADTYGVWEGGRSLREEEKRKRDLKRLQDEAQRRKWAEEERELAAEPVQPLMGEREGLEALRAARPPG